MLGAIGIVMKEECVCVCVCTREDETGPQVCHRRLHGGGLQTYHSSMEVTAKLSHTQSKLTARKSFVDLYCIKHKERETVI